jgi:hypothetical protein
MPNADDKPLAHFVAVFQQNWENARFIKSERLASANIYAIVVAGALSLMTAGRSLPMVELALLGFLWILSLVALLTSLRLKAELEDCLQRIQSLSRIADVEAYVSLGEIKQGIAGHVKFRWMFPILYSVTSIGFLILLGYRILVHLHVVAPLLTPSP